MKYSPCLYLRGKTLLTHRLWERVQHWEINERGGTSSSDCLAFIIMQNVSLTKTNEIKINNKHFCAVQNCSSVSLWVRCCSHSGHFQSSPFFRGKSLIDEANFHCCYFVNLHCWHCAYAYQWDFSHRISGLAYDIAAWLQQGKKTLIWGTTSDPMGFDQHTSELWGPRRRLGGVSPN